MNSKYKLAFDHLVLKLQSQRENLTQVRNRASISAAITGLIATFFATAIGPIRLSESMHGNTAFGFSLGATLLLLLFAGSIAFAGMTIVHQSDFTFAFDAEKMKQKMDDNDNDEFFSQYIEDGEWFFNDNEVKIGLAQTHLFWAIVLGWAQMFAWLLLM